MITKPGTRVRSLIDGNDVTKGNVYDVAICHDVMYNDMIEIEGDEGERAWLLHDEYEPIHDCDHDEGEYTMKVQVGDKVRITHTDYSGAEGYEVGDIQYIAKVDDDGDTWLGDDEYFFYHHEFELITQADNISAQIKARMEEHMSNGEYVRAVKWATVLEAVEGLENE